MTADRRVLERAFYERQAADVAAALLGQILVYRDKRLRIVETEAYVGPEDLACHAARGRRTARNEVMYGPPGHAYIYLIYGMYHCLNVVAESEGMPAAVLIRAGEPGARGPGVLCRELGLTRQQNGLDVTDPSSHLRIEAGRTPEDGVAVSPRIGIDYAGEWAASPLRFYLEGNPWVSGRRTAARRHGTVKAE